MDLQQFLSRSLGSFSEAFQSRHFNPGLSDEVRELAHRGLKLFPVSLTAKLSGCPDEFASEATCEIAALDQLATVAAQPFSEFRIALGPSGLCVLVLDGAIGRASLAGLVPDLAECQTLQMRRGDAVYAFFRQPARMKLFASRKLVPGVRALGEGETCIVPPFGAVWLNPGGDIEELPFALRQLLAPEDPDTSLGRETPAPRKGHPFCGQADRRLRTRDERLQHRERATGRDDAARR